MCTCPLDRFPHPVGVRVHRTSTKPAGTLAAVVVVSIKLPCISDLGVAYTQPASIEAMEPVMCLRPLLRKIKLPPTRKNWLQKRIQAYSSWVS